MKYRETSVLMLFCMMLGCATPSTPTRPVTPSRPPAPPRVIDYKHRMLKEISEEERIEKIKQAYGGRFEKESEEPTQAEKQHSMAQTLAMQDRGWPVDDWDVPQDTNSTVHPHRYHAGWEQRWNRRYYYNSDPWPIGNTLFFGTLGGVLGHQSGHRNEGILIGAAYGFLHDLLSW